ncbi:hypothetical protein AGMMS50212_05940 [Spirochaetia bacterium]|nr:hypothetical protein AGMMS50212_05940 [Spirochaetia bacterium]
MTKQDFVQAAFKVWGRELYKKTSLSDIAENLGVTKAALYRHFAGKEELRGAMFTAFFDRLSDSLLPVYKEAIAGGGGETRVEGILAITKAIALYYTRNRDDFIFAMTEAYGNRDRRQNIIEQLMDRGIDLMGYVTVDRDTRSHPSVGHLVMSTVICQTAVLHKHMMLANRVATEDEIRDWVDAIEKKIKYGLAWKDVEINSLNWNNLEKKAEEEARKSSKADEQKKILNAVASAVAEAGPWNASMKMVAERSGLSKSSLYSHFENKKDMLRQLFSGEFDKIINLAKSCSLESKEPVEQLYLSMMGIVFYLKANSQILTAMDWMKTRRLGLEKNKNFCPPTEDVKDTTMYEHIQTIFSNIKDQKDCPLINNRDTDLILFLIVNTLMRKPAAVSFSDLPNESFRILFKFIVKGIKE